MQRLRSGVISGKLFVAYPEFLTSVLKLACMIIPPPVGGSNRLRPNPEAPRERKPRGRDMNRNLRLRFAMKMSYFTVLHLFFVTTPSTRGAVENRTRPGELVIDPATLINLGFASMIEGDDNRNAKVEGPYRKQGNAGYAAGPA